MIYSGKAIIVTIDYAFVNKERIQCHGSLTRDTVLSIEPPSITLLLTSLKGETPDTINEKLAELASGGGEVRVRIDNHEIQQSF